MGLFIFPCAGNVGCSPLPCMLMRALSVHTAHETAGAARIRHSLRPLIGRGRTLLAKLGQNMPRECEVVSVPQHRCRPGQVSAANADPGPIRRGASMRAPALEILFNYDRRVVPAQGRDDEWERAGN